MKAPLTIGQKVKCNGCDGIVTHICEGQLEGMCEVRVPGGVACVSISEVLRFTPGLGDTFRLYEAAREAETSQRKFYSREISTPKTRADGLRNFVQMIINRIEAGENREALLLAVDLLDDLSGKAQPYGSVINSEDSAFKRQIEELERKHAKHLATEIAQARASGIEEGRRLQKITIAKSLGLD